MAGPDFFANMNDHRLKPRLLRSIVRDRLPEENRPFPAPFELSHIVSSIKNHGLLSESVSGPVDPKTMEGWKSAVDEWVDRLVSLVSGDMPDKCWAGICLLGLTCQECSSDRFQASYLVWFQKLLSKIQPPSDSHFVKVSSCAALSDLFTRLFGFPNVKKEGTSLSGKAVHPVLQLLSDDTVEVVEGAVDLLCTLVTLFPSSMHRHFDIAETAIVSKFMSGRCSMKMSEKFAKCIALLPKARGDNESWSLLMQRILISINVHLNESFELFEEETRHTEAMRLLVPSGKDPPPPFGELSLSDGTSDQGIKRFRQLLVPRISVLMQCCCAMLANSYPVQVTVPTRALLALVWRVLSVDGSLHASMSPFITSLHQELICSELPILHLETLDLLTAIIKGARRQLLPHAAGVARFLMEYFTRAALPDLRIKIYSIMRILLTSMGVGMALYIAQPVVNNAFADLGYIAHGNGSVSCIAYSSKASFELQQSSNKKRKHSIESAKESPNTACQEIEALSSKPTAPMSVQLAALEALEDLVTVGGAFGSESWRSDVDLLLVTVATNASHAGWSHGEKFLKMVDEQSITRADFQLAAFKALLASLLSPAHVRPPYLSQGLELFQRGKQETSTKLAEFCAHATMALEVLIHPRSLPLSDIPANDNHKFPDSINSSDQMPKTPFLKDGMGLDDKQLYNSWLGFEETKDDTHNPDKPTEDSKDAGDVIHKDSEAEMTNSKVLGGAIGGTEEPKNTVDVHMRGEDEDQSMVDVQPSESRLCGVNGGIVACDNNAVVSASNLSGDVLEPRQDAASLVTVPDKSRRPNSPILDKGKELGFQYDSDTPSMNSLPEIKDIDSSDSDE